MWETQLEIRDKIGYLLLKKGIINADILEKALEIKGNEKNKLKRNLAQILVDDFHFDHDTIFKEVAILYAFKEIDIKIDALSNSRLEELKRMFDYYPDDIKDLLLKHCVIPYKYDDKIKDKLILAAVDPTDRSLTKIAYRLNAKKYEINYLHKKDYEKLIQFLAPPENEFLKMLEDVDEEITLEKEETSLDEEELDSEINKSALINLIEAALVEGVRKGASDIHIVPKSNSKTEILFRIDGKLMLWHTQENTMPEAIMAVVKDRSRGMDRFERERAQDGFIQREIDNQIGRAHV